MRICSVLDPEFKPYGQLHHGCDIEKLTAAMDAIPLPDNGVAYEPAISALEAVPGALEWFRDVAYGGMPVQLGMCWGRNTKLNCLEYHRDSEFNLGAGDFILLLARQEEIENGKLDTGKIKAFRVPAGVVVEIFATTLHYAPCHTDETAGFRTLVALPKGTNGQRPPVDDPLLTARNKWLLAHAESDEAKHGAVVGLIGTNIDLSKNHQGGNHDE